MKVDIIIVNFNTTTVTNNCIKSIINKIKSFDYKIHIIDNGKIKFKLDEDINKDLVDITDSSFLSKNTYFEYKDLKIFNKDIPNLCGDFSHSIALQYALDNVVKSDYVLICDSDVIFKKDIDFIDDINTVIGYKEKKCGFIRFCPYLLFLNFKKIKENNLEYLNALEWIKEYKKSFKPTGYVFTNKIIENKLSYKLIDIYDYIDHLTGTSFLEPPVNINDSRKWSIQKTIWFVWFGDIEPNYIKYSIESYKKLNPEFDCIYIYYTFQDIKDICKNNIIEDEYDLILYNCYKTLNNATYSQLLDIYIKSLLNNYGGIYCHLDTLCIKPFDYKIMKKLYFNCNYYIDHSFVLKFKRTMIGCTKNYLEYYKSTENIIPPINYYKNYKSFYNLNCNIQDIDKNLNYIQHFNASKSYKIGYNLTNDLNVVI